MKKMLKITAIALLFALSASLFGCGEPKLPDLPPEPETVFVHYYLIHDEERILLSTDAIVAGTVMEQHPARFSDSYGHDRWLTFVELQVEDVLYGSVEKGKTIQIIYRGAEGRQLYSDFERVGSFPKQGERILYILRSYEGWPETGEGAEQMKAIHKRNAYGLLNIFAGIRTVDDDGTLGYRYDPFEIGYEKDDLPFYEYKTVDQLREALQKRFPNKE